MFQGAKKNEEDTGVQGQDKKEDTRTEEQKTTNVDEIASTIMSMIDAVDAENNNKIKSICITIGLE